jgi:hypothetical protein
MITSSAQKKNRKVQDQRDRLDRIAALLEQADNVLTESESIRRLLPQGFAISATDALRSSKEQLDEALRQTRHHCQYLELTSSGAVLELVREFIASTKRIADVVSGPLDPERLDSLDERIRLSLLEFHLDRDRLVRFARSDQTFEPSWAPMLRRFFGWSRDRQLRSRLSGDHSATTVAISPSAAEATINLPRCGRTVVWFW